MVKEQATPTSSLGFFTSIARVIAVIAFALGSFLGIISIWIAISENEGQLGLFGLAMLLLGWVLAPILGMLAEISIKLSKSVIN